MAAPAPRAARCQRASDFRLAGLSPRGSPVNLALASSMRDAWAAVRPCVFIIGGLAAAHCAVIFWPPLPRLTIHRVPDDTVPARASVTGYSNPGGSRRPLIMGSLQSLWTSGLAIPTRIYQAPLLPPPGKSVLSPASLWRKNEASVRGAAGDGDKFGPVKMRAW